MALVKDGDTGDVVDKKKDSLGVAKVAHAGTDVDAEEAGESVQVVGVLAHLNNLCARAFKSLYKKPRRPK